MADADQLDLAHALTAIEAPGAVLWVTSENVPLYDMSAAEFLSFAKQDLEEDSERARLNGINNAKRAIACRVDEILTLSVLDTFMRRERWGLPLKLEVIKKLGCPAPPVLRGYITSRRNRLEHEYTRPPTEEEVRYVADVAELFLGATDEYVKFGRIREARIEVSGEGVSRVERGKEIREVPTRTLVVKIDAPTHALSLRYSESLATTTINRRTGEIRSSAKPLAESRSAMLNISDCDKQQFTELQRAIRAHRKR